MRTRERFGNILGMIVLWEHCPKSDHENETYFDFEGCVCVKYNTPNN